MTVTFMEDGRQLDIMVKPEQKIESVYEVLLENGLLPVKYRYQDVRLSVYSVRRNAYVNPMLTFRQGEIYNGDILEVKGNGYEDSDSEK